MNFIPSLKRKTNSVNFIPEIDGLRFFAIITVVIFHSNSAYSDSIDINWKSELGVENFDQLGWWLIRLDLGVKIFFAISGFILAVPFLRHYLGVGNKVSLRDYFNRRLTRLEPPFVISLLGFYCVHVIVLKENAYALLPNLVSGLFYSHTFIFGKPSPINPVTWSLETEAQFYILIPFAFMFILWLKKGWLKISFIAALLFLSIYFKSFILSNGPAELYYSVLVYLANFICGILFALLYIKRPKLFSKRGYSWDFIGMGAVFLLFYFYKPQAYWVNSVAFNLSIFIMFVSVFKGKFLNWFYTRSLIYVIGGMCYTIYLLHYAFFHLSVKLTSSISLGQGYIIDLFLQILMVLPFLIIICLIFFLIIEKPCMNKNWPSLLRQKLNFKDRAILASKKIN